MSPEHFTLTQSESGKFIIAKFVYQGSDSWSLHDLASFERRDHAESFLLLLQGPAQVETTVRAGLRALSPTAQEVNHEGE